MEATQTPTSRWLHKDKVTRNSLECYLDVKKNETLSFPTKQMELEIIILSEISQSPAKNKYQHLYEQKWYFVIWMLFTASEYTPAEQGWLVCLFVYFYFLCVSLLTQWRVKPVTVKPTEVMSLWKLTPPQKASEERIGWGYGRGLSVFGGGFLSARDSVLWNASNLSTYINNIFLNV